MAANMYRVGDYVYFETASTAPYQIRRIEELNKNPSGNVEAKVMCFYRRKEISNSLIMLADKHQSSQAQMANGLVSTIDSNITNGDGIPAAQSSQSAFEKTDDGSELKISEASPSCDTSELDDKQTHQLKHRELFLSRQVETLPATHIRGKCAVTLLNETESLLSYLNKDDAFFYSLVYDPQQKTLLADKGEIRVGIRFQAEDLKYTPDDPMRNSDDLETLIWEPTQGLSDRQIDQFMVIARSVGTFARALDCTSTVRQPSLHMSAAAASRDVTLFHAMDTLHKHRYDTSKAISSLVPAGGPVLCRDEMEEWSASEANLFEEALDKYGKDFNDIRQDFLPWKSLKSIVEYYYMWKTTDRYVQQKRIKAAEAETKLKQVYIPNYNKPNPAQITNPKLNGTDGNLGRGCEGCLAMHHNVWYMWGPTHMNYRLCGSCWFYWKKYGGLKRPSRSGKGEDVRLEDNASPASGIFEQNGETVGEGFINGQLQSYNQRDRLQQMAAMRMHRCTYGGCGKEFKLKTHLAKHLATAHGLAIRSGSPSSRPVMKTRAAFCLITTQITRISRQVCADILKVCTAARQPFQPINIAAIKQECQVRLPTLMKAIKSLKPRKRASSEAILSRLGIDTKQEKPYILHRNTVHKEPTHLSFPRPSSAETKMMPSPQVENLTTNVSPSIMKKRGYDQVNGIESDGPQLKRLSRGVIRQVGPMRQMRDTVINQFNGRSGKTVGRGRKQVMSWIDAPDDVYFVATDSTRKLRKKISQMESKRAARKPWRKLNITILGIKDLYQIQPHIPILIE